MSTRSYTPLFKGYEEFERLRDEGKIRPGTVIRVRGYACNIDPHYIVTTRGLMELDNGSLIPDPESVLSGDAAPDGWEIEGHEPRLLPEWDLKKHS